MDYNDNEQAQQVVQTAAPQPGEALDKAAINTATTNNGAINKEAVDSEAVDSEAVNNEAEQNSPENEKAKKKKVKATREQKQSYISGIFSGVLITSLIMLAATIIIFVSKGYRIRFGTSQQTAETGTSMQETVLDDDTIAKINAVLATFDKASILELDTETFQRALIDGVISGSGDKYAQYYDATEISNLMGDYGGTFYGIGAELSMNSVGYAEVQSVYTNSPAQLGGLRSGDVIVKVDGDDIYGLTLDEMVTLIRGPEGTEVVITIAREGESNHLDITLTRAKIEIVVVEYEMLEDNIGYIYIAQWYDTTPDQFAAAMKDLYSQGMEGLVIDLRSNTGGLLRSVVAVAQQMLPKGTIVYTEDKNGRGSTYESNGSSEIDIPVVILTNGYTASASEILTGAMKDHGKAISLGTKTYGKGVVQSFFNFTDGTAMKLTTEQYFTPNGTAIDGVGIAPDIEVEFDSEAYYDEENFYDNQLEAAVDYLEKEIN